MREDEHRNSQIYEKRKTVKPLCRGLWGL